LSELRAVTVTMGDIRSLTILEVARAGVIAGVNRADTEMLLRTLVDPASPPEDLERGALLMYAWAYMLVKREEPDATWEDAQKWRVVFDITQTDEVADAIADATVRAAAVTGLTPEQAGQLTLGEMDTYREIAVTRAG
jgi:hypothetical protein